jgi:hypothetical protein
MSTPRLAERVTVAKPGRLIQPPSLPHAEREADDRWRRLQRRRGTRRRLLRMEIDPIQTRIRGSKRRDSTGPERSRATGQ